MNAVGWTTIGRLLAPLWTARMRASVKLRFDVVVVHGGTFRIVGLDLTKRELNHSLRINRDVLYGIWDCIYHDFGIDVHRTALTVYFIGAETDVGKFPRFAARHLTRSNAEGCCWFALRTLFVFLHRSRSLIRTLVHELAHAALESLPLQSRIGYSVFEGYTYLIADRFTRPARGFSTKEWAIRTVGRAIAQGECFSIDMLCQLNVHDVSQFEVERVKTFHAQSVLFAAFLESCLAEQGAGVVAVQQRRRLWNKGDSGARIGETFEMGLDDLEERFRRYCCAQVAKDRL